MIRAEASVERNADAATAVREGVTNGLHDALAAGFERSQDVIASEATDTGTLLQSGFPPRRTQDGTIVSGYTARYAAAVDRGTRPHWPPIDPLLGWARRVLGDESAAYAVQQKIAAEGTEGVHFMREFVETTKAHLRARGLSAAIDEVI